MLFKNGVALWALVRLEAAVSVRVSAHVLQRQTRLASVAHAVVQYGVRPTAGRAPYTDPIQGRGLAHKADEHQAAVARQEALVALGEGSARFLVVDGRQEALESRVLGVNQWSVRTIHIRARSSELIKCVGRFRVPCRAGWFRRVPQIELLFTARCGLRRKTKPASSARRSPFWHFRQTPPE